MTDKNSKNPNVDRASERRKSKETEDLEDLKDKYKDGSHTENVNSREDENGFRDQKSAKDKDMESSEAPLLDRKKKKEQQVKIKDKSNLDKNEG